MAVLLIFDSNWRIYSVDVPGWERDPIPGTEKGTPDALMGIYEDVLSDDMLQALREEAPVMAEFAKTFGNLNHNSTSSNKTTV